jgi:hypothetical protein
MAGPGDYDGVIVKRAQDINVNMKKRNQITKDLHGTKYRNRVVPNKKKKEELKRLKRFYILEYLR